LTISRAEIAFSSRKPGTGFSQVPQVQSGPQVQFTQVQFGLSQPLEGWPQLQSGPQVQGEQVQFGF
jgi:hypothetical protein